MNGGSSTFRAGHDRTTGDSRVAAKRLQLQELIVAEWRRTAQPNLVVAIEQHPELLRDQSLLLNLALEEYKSLRAQTDVIDLNSHCRRFEIFGSSIERSLFRQLETQKYLDEHPELLQLLSSPRWPELGEEFTSFVVIEELGRGGLSRVFLCEEPELGNREVVVKVSPLTSIEASVLGRLNHPNIVPVHSTGRVADRNLSYICMPFLGRSTLADLIEKAFHSSDLDSRGMTEPSSAQIGESEFCAVRNRQAWWTDPCKYVDRVFDIAVKVGSALEFSHDAGIIHGDLKPSNILLPLDGEPLLLDFNLSRDIVNPASWCGGTLPYMPPEQLELLVRGDTDDCITNIDIRTDVYSFAAVMYELLTGEPPVVAEPSFGSRSILADKLLQNLRTSDLRVRKANRLVSRKLEDVLRRSLAVAPEDRPKSISEIRCVFERERALLPKFARSAKARPIRYASVIGLVVLAGAAFAIYAATRPPFYLTEFQHGADYLSVGDLQSAEESFRNAASAAPEFAPARFELARLRVKRGELEKAIADFSLLARVHHDIRSLAYLGYCHNLSGKSLWAIPFHIKSIEQGVNSAAVKNNLAASYLAAPTALPPMDRISSPESLLLAALQLDGDAVAVRANLVQLEIARSMGNRELDDHDPIGAMPHVLFLKEREPDSPWVRGIVATWYLIIHKRLAVKDNATIENADDLNGILQWIAPTLLRPEFASVLADDGVNRQAPSGGELVPDDESLRGRFMEPL